MKLFMYCLLLATMVVTAAPIRARRDNVLSFLNDTLGTSTEETAPANTTAYRNPPSEPVKEQDSEETENSFTDMSEDTSTESSDNSGLTGPEASDKNGGESRDAVQDLDSDEIVTSKDVEKDKAPPRRKPNVGLMEDQQGSREHGGPQGSREHGGLQGPQRASRERTDLNSDEGATVDENVSGKQVIHLSGGRVIQRKPRLGRVHGVNGMLVLGSRELVDLDSLEDNNGRPAPGGNRGNADYDETRELISSETYPVAPPVHLPSSLSVPARSRASR